VGDLDKDTKKEEYLYLLFVDYFYIHKTKDIGALELFFRGWGNQFSNLKFALTINPFRKTTTNLF